MALQLKLSEKLSSSTAVTSLRTERAVVNILRALGWWVTHGSFFTDPTTQKPRELDISAKRFWIKFSRGQKQHATIHVKCEIKSARDYHLVFAPRVDRSFAFMKREWIGYQGKRLSAELEKAGLESEMIQKILNRFEKLIAYPSGFIRPYRLLLHPLPALIRSTAFRETNIGGEKDLDVSVLWKATQSLNAAVESDRNKLLNNEFEDIRNTAEFTLRLKKDLLEIMSKQLSSSSNYVELYHPVIVTESKLWYLSDNILIPINWCRFYQVGVDPFEQWCDVVSMKYVKQYFQKLTRYYQSKMKRAGAKRESL